MPHLQNLSCTLPVKPVVKSACCTPVISSFCHSETLLQCWKADNLNLYMGKISEVWIGLDVLFPDVFFTGLERELLWFWIINHSLVQRHTILGEYNNTLTDMLIDGFTCWLHCPLFKIRQLTLRFFLLFSADYK